MKLSNIKKIKMYHCKILSLLVYSCKIFLFMYTIEKTNSNLYVYIASHGLFIA